MSFGILPAHIPGVVRARILQLADRLRTHSLVNQVILYGSFAVGTYRADSDIDIAVFLQAGNDCGLEVYRELNRLIGETGYDIQIQIFSMDELDDPCGIVEEIVEHGIVLWDKTLNERGSYDRRLFPE